MHRMTLISFRLFRENLGHLKKKFGANGSPPPLPPPWQKIARTLMVLCISCLECSTTSNFVRNWCTMSDRQVLRYLNTTYRGIY